MRYRWDPPYPMGRREGQAPDAGLRASDDERNQVVDRLSRHYAEGRLDEAEFKARLDACMSAKTRGELTGLFHDLPRLATAPPPPPPRRHRARRFLAFAGLLVLVAAAVGPWWWPVHFPFFLFAFVAFVLWRRSDHWHHHHARDVEGEPRSSVRDH
jgi:Domain of unknown function (DUF1707)